MAGSDRIRIEIRTTREEKDAAQAACEARGSDLSKEIRAFLARMAKRAGVNGGNDG